MQTYPFTAIVGQERMKRALALNAISPQIGGVLIRGERGTAKSTAARALAQLLPQIEVVADCPFSCDPHNADDLCDQCRARLEAGEALPVALQRTRFVNLPVSATEDRVVGAIDIEQAIKLGERHFEPGVLALANRGMLYVDEVNLLDDHVVDLLLDSAAMGVNTVEREGISFSHPARFILVGTMNPEEGDLRPQLLDRFSLCVDIEGIADQDARVQILERRVAYDLGPEAFYEQWRAREEELSQRIVVARTLLPSVRYARSDLYTIAALTSELQVDGHRADIVILKTALAHAAFEARGQVREEDILLAAELALPHRFRRRPFDEPGDQMETLAKRLEQARAKADAQPAETTAPSQPVKKKAAPLNAEPSAEPRTPPEVPLRGHHADAQPLQSGPHAGAVANADRPFVPRPLRAPLDRLPRRPRGRRTLTITANRRGRYTYARYAPGDYRDIALDATLRQAAPAQHRRNARARMDIRPQDLHRKVRTRKAANLIVFAVDASWSMAAAARMQATKGAILSLLMDAYQKRDQVALVSFQRNTARLVLPLTSSVERAQRALKHLPVGGKTPLSAGLLLAHEVIRRAQRRQREVMPLLILLTDGAGNVALSERPPQEEALLLAHAIASDHIRSVVVNTEHVALDRGLSQQLATALNAPCYTLEALRAESLYKTVRNELESKPQ